MSQQIPSRVNPLNDVQAIKERLIAETDIADKTKFAPILDLGVYAEFRNYVRYAHKGYPHEIKGGMPPRVAQYPIKDAEVEDLEKLERIIKNLCDAGLKIEGGKGKIGKVPRV